MIQKPLQQSDSFKNGSIKQYKELFQIVHPDKPKLAISDMGSQAHVRRGVFWSERNKTLVPGNLLFAEENSQLEYDEFLERLKMTISNLD